MSPRIYIPIVFNNSSPVIGVQLAIPSTEYLLPNSMVETFIHWSVIEAQRGIYNWTSCDGLIYKLNRYKTIICIKSSPNWAREVGTLQNNAPSSEYHIDFGNFVLAVINRYHPYAIEVWNEPDAHPGMAEYYGDIPDVAVYLKLLEQVYIKSNSSSLILAGALANPISDYGKAVMASSYCDGISFHSYSYYPNPDYSLLGQQVSYIRTRTSKPVWVTETSLLSNSADTLELERAQAEYYKFILRNNGGATAILWYALNGSCWKNNDLVRNNKKTLAYGIYETVCK
jgi:hypothetical protein